ncbi:MAG: glycogen synthase GlgA [Burkholderiales bacterium]|nr:glycogen synthase GlgA [Burkholderiales bacterium]
MPRGAAAMSAPAALRVLFVTSEITPWMKSGGLGDVSAALPAALRAAGVDVRVLVPAFRPLLAEFGGARCVATFTAPGGAMAPARLLAASTTQGVPLFMVDCPEYYHRRGDAYQDHCGEDWPDNDLRFGLLGKVAALIPAARPVEWEPQIVHCNDWPTALAPVYLRYGAAGHRVRSIMTVHNLAFQGIFPAASLARLGLSAEAMSVDGVEYYGKLSFLKGGLVCADRITTVSPTYAREIQSEELGYGLDGLLRHRSGVITGILNGIDTGTWNPATDSCIASTYDSAHIERKAENKAALRRLHALPEEATVPLVGVISRLTWQKGIDLITDIAPQLARLPAQLVVLGTGERKLTERLAALVQAFPRQIVFTAEFNERLAHLIEAGADIFLMPSRFEPCGLNQMYSLRYGTPPVVRATGGLADTVVDCNEAMLEAGTANGFVFTEPDAPQLLAALGRAVATWHDRKRWKKLQRNGMRLDFGWRASAGRYCELYRAVVAAT